MARKGKCILVIHGPNLNKLGIREPEIYGSRKLEDINDEIRKSAEKIEIETECFQTNHEGEIIDRIQNMENRFDGLIINPAAFTHTSVAIRDALALLDIPIVEVHISNIYKREPFRHTSLTAGAVTGQISGFGIYGYVMAVNALGRLMNES